MKTWLRAAIISILLQGFFMFIQPRPMLDSERQLVEISVRFSDTGPAKSTAKPAREREKVKQNTAPNKKIELSKLKTDDELQTNSATKPPAGSKSNSTAQTLDRTDSTLSDTSFLLNTFYPTLPMSRFRKQDFSRDSTNTSFSKTHQFQKVEPGDFSGLEFPSYKDSTYFSATPGPVDHIDRRLNRETPGAGKHLSVTGALAAGAQQLQKSLKSEKPVRFRQIPSRTELSVFKVLWEKEKATSLDIYAHIDTGIHVSAEDFNHVLNKMTTQGMLQRKLISPRNEFTLGMIGGGIEMSPKNRRNRVYEYECRVRPEHVIRYLNAALYHLESGTSAENDTVEVKLKKDLQEKILRTAEQLE